MDTPSPQQSVEIRLARQYAGMSLIEVMIALSVFAVAIVVILGHNITLDNLRANSLSRALQTVAVNNVVNLLDGSNWDELGRTQRPWSLSRLQSGVATNPPLTLADLVGEGVVSRETGHFAGAKAADASKGDLNFYVEYYRATANLDPSLVAMPSQPGLLDAQQTSGQGFKAAFASTAAACRIVPDPNLGLVDATQLTAGNPVMIRLVVGDGPTGPTQRQVYETFIGTQTAPQ